MQKLVWRDPQSRAHPIKELGRIPNVETLTWAHGIPTLSALAGTLLLGQDRLSELGGNSGYWAARIMGMFFLAELIHSAQLGSRARLEPLQLVHSLFGHPQVSRTVSSGFLF